MPHTCEDCGETFETLSRLRLHDCPEDQEAIEREREKQDEEYEHQLSDEWENYEEGEYWGFHRVFFGPAVDGLETAVLTEG